MKAKYFRTFSAIACAVLFCAATLISSQSLTSAETKKPTQGQDVGDKDCERITGPESSTFGKCKSVCKDKDVTWDAVGRRYVCNAKAAVRRPGIRVPIGDAVLESSTKQTPKRPPVADTKAKKAKKN